MGYIYYNMANNKKKDGYIPDLDTEDEEIFGVAHVSGTPNPAICWIQYE